MIIDKPEGMTSHDVVARVRRIFGTKSVGHTGTLDPFATGVLVILVGNATRLARFLEKDVKEYVAEVQFGTETDTGDRTGSRISDCGLSAAELSERLRTTDWGKTLDEFRGESLQTPPMYSAKKVSGRKLYELAREGEVIERQPVPITVYELAIVDQSEIASGRVVIRVACSAGTYVRTLAEDIGRRVGVGAHLSALRRTAAGQFDLRRSQTLERLKGPSPHLALWPIDLAVAHLSEFELPDNRVAPTRNGLSTSATEARWNDGEFIRMTYDGNVIAVGVYDDAEKCVRPKVVLI